MKRLLTKGLAVAVLAFAAYPTAPVLSQTNSAAGEVARLNKRVEQLEEQLVDLHVMIGTLQSLARNAQPSSSVPTAPPPTGFTNSAEAGRIAALETQVRALTAQIERLNRGQSGVPQAPGRQGSNATSYGQGANAYASHGNPGQTRFGSTTVAVGQGAPAIPGQQAYSAQQPATTYQTPTQGASLAPSQNAVASDGAQQAYEAAYGQLLQQDFRAAQASFKDFLARYPKNGLAGNAQYWLGETHYVQGRYKSAAQAFLVGYEKYGKGSKGPDSLLKLAMSLGKLGQKSAACSSLRELQTRYPRAPRQLQDRAGSERRRLRC